MALTALKVKNAKPGRYVDGRGLCLFVKESGSRSWVLRMQHNGRRRDYGLGSALDVTLTEARDAAAALRRQVRSGIDPVAERRKSRKVVPSFETAARECYEALKDGWKNQNYRNWISSMENHVFPLIGRKPVDQVDSTHVVEVLTPIWLEIPDTARKILQRIGAVLDFAHIKGWREEEAALRSVRKGLPRQTDKVEHFKAMPYADIPAFMKELAAASPTTGRDALRFTIYNAVRSSETRKAVWTEIDFDPYAPRDAERLLSAWMPLTVALNMLNRSMGQRDLYPFSLPDQVQRKIAFVHDLVAGWRAAARASMGRQTPDKFSQLFDFIYLIDFADSGA